MIEIRRIDKDFKQFEELLALILSAFAYMDGVIDPPSSAHLLTAENLAEKAQREIGLVAVENAVLMGCVFCKPEAQSLYIGKLAVSLSARGRGVGQLLLREAEQTARSLGCPALRLETRIELVDNHKRFGSWGFVKTAEKAHAGYDRITQIEMMKRLA